MNCGRFGLQGQDSDRPGVCASLEDEGKPVVMEPEVSVAVRPREGGPLKRPMPCVRGQCSTQRPWRGASGARKEAFESTLRWQLAAEPLLSEHVLTEDLAEGRGVGAA